MEERTTRTLAPKACGGRLDLNFDFTTPLLPCGRVTRLRDHKRWCNIWRPGRPYPQITRTFDPAICRLARYTYATRCENAIIQYGRSRRDCSEEYAPFRGRTVLPPLSKRPRSEEGKCWDGCYVCRAYGQVRALCCRVCGRDKCQIRLFTA